MNKLMQVAAKKTDCVVFRVVACRVGEPDGQVEEREVRRITGVKSADNEKL